MEKKVDGGVIIGFVGEEIKVEPIKEEPKKAELEKAEPIVDETPIVEEKAPTKKAKK